MIIYFQAGLTAGPCHLGHAVVEVYAIPACFVNLAQARPCGIRSTLSQPAKEILFEEQERGIYFKWTKIGHCEAAMGWI